MKTKNKKPELETCFQSNEWQDEILSLKEKRYASTVMLPLGYSDEKHDWLAKETKTRKNIKDLVEVIK